jgi:general secretion pathway protein E
MDDLDWLDYDEDETEVSHVVGLVASLVSRAIVAGATTARLDPGEEETRVRFRVKGDLIEEQPFAAEHHLKAVARLKILAGMDICERRLPQSGSFAHEEGHRLFDVVAETLPTHHGERVTLHLTEDTRRLFDLDQLGLAADHHEALVGLLAERHGVLLVAAPSGAGRTATLYAVARHLADAGRDVLTCEDPVDQPVPGLAQVQVDTPIGMTFARVLEASLRQDPDAIVVGEIRDQETSDLVMKAALAGCLVVAVMHTADASGTLVRLLDMGLEPHLVTAAVRGVLAQRLVPRAAPEEGDIGVFELLVVDDATRRLLREGATRARIREAARKAGMRTLREDGERKAEAGLTTMPDVLRLTPADP